MRRWSLFTQSALTVLPFGTALILALWLAGGASLQNHIRAEMETYVADAGKREATRIKGRLDATRGFLQSLARNDLIINGLLDVGGRASYLPAFFRSLEMPGFGAAHLHLRDYKGRIIVQNDGDTKLGRADGPGPRESNEPPAASTVGVSFEEPVLYLGSVEGSIEIMYPASSFPQLFGVSPFGDDFFVLNKAGAIVYSTDPAWASPGGNIPIMRREGWVEVSQDLGRHGMRIVVASSGSKWVQFFDGLRRLEFAGLTLFMVLAVGMALVVAYRTSRPLKAFAQAIKDFPRQEAGIAGYLPEEGPRELNELARAFNAMADKVEGAMREKQKNIAFVENILNSLPLPVLVHRGGAVAGLNDAFRHLFGIDTAERQGTSCRRLLEDIRLEQGMTERIIGGECFAHVDSRGKGPGGEDLNLVFWQTQCAQAGTSGEEPFFLVTMADVTWRFKMASEKAVLERELRQAQKLEAVGQLAGGIAHEINTPAQYVGDNLEFLASAFEDLRTVVGSSMAFVDSVRGRAEFSSEIDQIDVLAKEADLDYLFAELPTAIEHSRDGVRQISRIVLAMKEFSHPSAKEKTYVDLNHAIENTVTISRNEWKHVAEMDLRLDPTLRTVPCLPGEMNQVFLNLIVNAAHALGEAGRTAEDGRITVSTAVEDGAAVIRIADNGPGIPAEIQDKIFDPFFTTKAVGKGTGQGLTIARDIVVNKHDGRIDFETRPGEGTTFSIRLPLTMAPSKSEGDRQAAKNR